MYPRLRPPELLHGTGGRDESFSYFFYSSELAVGDACCLGDVEAFL